VRKAGPSADDDLGNASSEESSDGVYHDLELGAAAPPVMEAWASKNVELDVDREEPAKVTDPGGRSAGGNDAGGIIVGHGRFPNVDVRDWAVDECLLGVDASPGTRQVPNRSAGGLGDVGGVVTRGWVLS